jgi:hypothetical protein
VELSKEIIDEVLFEYKRTRSPFRTATNVGLDTAMVWKIIEDNADKLSAHPERNGGQGRPEIIQFIVARRRVTAREWDNQSQDIAEARAKYELGTHDMATGRDGCWLILYSIPLKRAVPRTNYFKPESF